MFDMNLSAFHALIHSDAPKNVILDTDTYNEVDDQFCLALCMLAKEKINLLSVNAAPFLNQRSSSAGEGMEKSYNEIFKVMNLVDPSSKIPVYRGSATFLPDRNTPVVSAAAQNIVDTVKSSGEPVIVIAIGAITNVASALLMWPDLAKHAAVIWLGGHAMHHWDSREFNMRQDVPAAQIVFDSGIPLFQIPCAGVCTEVVTSVPELNYYLAGKNALSDYLIGNVAKECEGRFAGSRIIWDITAAIALICPDAYNVVTIPRPLITSDSRYTYDLARPHYFYVRQMNRDKIYGTLFKYLANA